MKPKAQTYQQKLGFFDEDLKKPKHDEIMYWLDSNVENIMKDLMFKKICTSINRLPTSQIIDTKYKIDKVWEMPVISKNGYNKFIIGYIDFYFSFSIPYRSKNLYDEFVENDYILGSCFEVKSEIKSAGELIRQINTYREYNKCDFYVVCPDTTHANLLKEQGIHFIEYPSGKIL